MTTEYLKQFAEDHPHLDDPAQTDYRDFLAAAKAAQEDERDYDDE